MYPVPSHDASFASSKVDAFLTIADGTPDVSHFKKPQRVLGSDRLTGKKEVNTPPPRTLDFRLWTLDFEPTHFPELNPSPLSVVSLSVVSLSNTSTKPRGSPGTRTGA